jgi:hypothetical protein
VKHHREPSSVENVRTCTAYNAVLFRNKYMLYGQAITNANLYKLVAHIKVPIFFIAANLEICL